MASSLDAGQTRYVRLAALLRELSASEVAVQRNALRARAGLLHNYDPLVTTMNAALAAAHGLHDASPEGSALRVLATGLLRATEQQERDVEQFKTDNALLQNSAAFFDEVSGQVMAAVGPSPVSEAVGALASAMLQVTHGSTPNGEARVAAHLNALAALVGGAPASAQASDAALLVRHGRLLGALLARVDASLRGLQAGASGAQQAAILAQLDADRLADETRADRFKVTLYDVALLLLGALWTFGLRLRERARTLCCKLAVKARARAGWLCCCDYAAWNSSCSLMNCTASASALAPSPKARSTMRASPRMSPVTLKARAWPFRSARMTSKPLMVA